MAKLFFNVQTCIMLMLLISSVACEDACQITIDENGESTDNCPSLHSCIEGTCVHKDIFPLTFGEIIGTILLMFMAGLANAGGLGGGALLTPILLIFFNYNPNKSIMIVYGIVFGGALGNFLNVAFKRNPKTGKPYVDYDLSLICMPPMVGGAMIGVIINHICASIFIIVGLIIVIYTTGQKIYKKAVSAYQAETNSMSKALLDVKNTPKPAKEFELTPLVPSDRDSAIEPSTDQGLKEILDEENLMVPPQKLTKIALLLGFVIIMAIAKGTKDMSSFLGVDYCGVGYWFLFVLTIGGCVYAYIKGVENVKHNLEIKRAHNYKSPEGEFVINDEIISKLGPLSAIAGVLAGLLGLGGGMVMNPVLLQLGMGAQPLAATVGFFVVQTSFITLFQSFLYGYVTGTELTFFLIASFVGSFGVSYVLNFFVKKYNRPSFILFTLSSVLLLSFIIMPIFGLYKSIDAPSEMFTFHSLC